MRRIKSFDSRIHFEAGLIVSNGAEISPFVQTGIPAARSKILVTFPNNSPLADGIWF
jgi:hypothetical protein